MAEKAFDPTPSRLARAVRDGDVATSHELTGVCAFAAALAAAAFAAPHLAAGASALLMAASRQRTGVGAAAAFFAWLLLPAAAGACASVAASAAQASGLRIVALKFETARLSPSANVQRMFSRETLVTLARACAAFLCAALALGSVRTMRGDSLAQAAWNGALRAAWTIAAVGFVFAAADFAIQSARRHKRLRMSHEELRRDRKEQDGDPATRSRRQAAHRAVLRGSVRLVRDAAFVVTNPTHIAIALEYAPPRVAVPRVLVRAADEAAAVVRALAARHRIPVIEHIALARELYERAQPGESIPHETFIAVAEIVAELTRSGALS